MDRRSQINSRWIRLVFYLILFVPPGIRAEDEYALFKLIANQQEIGQIEAVCRSDGIYASLPELIGKLGYPYRYEPAATTFSTCCPDNTRCFSLHADTLYIGSEKRILPDSVLIVRTENLYLRTDYFEQLCDIPLQILFQSFKIQAQSNRPFPFEALRSQELRRQEFKIRKENNHLQSVDTIALRKAYLNTLGYAATASLSKNGFEGYDVLASTNAEFLRGALNMNYIHSKYKNSKQQELNFRHTYEFDRRWIRQFSVFRQTSTLLMSNLSGYANGIYLSNDNATFFNRRYYLYKSKTRPGANVEIYSNGELSTFVTADSLGNFEAIVPVTEGENTISAVTFNDYGESASDEQTIFIAQDLLPHKQFRYQLSSGVSDEGMFFTGATAEYGLTSFLTISSRAEVTLKEKHTSLLAGAGIKLSPWNWLQLGAEYYPYLKYRLILTGTSNRRFSYNFSYEQYRKGQQLLPLAPMRDIRAGISGELPLSWLHHSISFSLRDLQYQFGNSFSSSLRLTVFRGSFLLSSYFSSTSRKSFKFENFSYGGKVGYKINQALYNEFSYDRQENIRESIFRDRFQFKLTNSLQGNLAANYHMRANYTSIELGVTYRFPWTTFKGNGRATFPGWSIDAGIEGAVRFYPNRNMEWSNRNTSGASLHVALFADINGNQSYDKGEPILPDANVLVKTGAEITRKPSGIYFRNIAPGYAFKVIIPRQPLGEISWQITPVEKILYLSPGQSHSLYIPVQVISEISGEVYCSSKGKRKPIGGVTIEITRREDNQTIRERTDEWGTYYFTGLTAGTYTVKAISKQSSPTFEQQHTIVIPEGKEGIQVDHIDFVSEK